MNKVRVLSLVASSLLATSLMAETQTMFLEKGWNLKGSNLNSANVNGANLSATLKYTSNGWEQDKGDGTLTLNAGEGFWVQATKETAVFLKGSSATEAVKFEKAGWHLATPVNGSLSLASLNSEKFESIWSYRSGQWLDKDKMLEAKITKLELGDGFWIKTSEDGLTISNLLEDATVNAVSTGSVDLSSIINPITGEVESRRALREENINPLTGEVIPDEATVQVYEADDTTFSTPLLKEAVVVNPITGEYIITEGDLSVSVTTNSNENADINPLTGKIIRVIAKKDDKNYDLSALATDSKRVDVNPITTSIRTQIIDTIKTMFGENFAKEMKENSAIMSSINSLATAIGSKVEQDIKDGKISLRQADFETTKKPEQIINPLTGEEIIAKEEKDEKLKTQLNTSSASTDVAKFESEVSYQKKSTLNLEEMDISKSATNVDIAIMEYDIISSFAKMNLAVHDGNGRLVLFLPVPPEEFDKLPGEKFKKTVKKEDGSEFVVGDDPAIRAIDLEKSLKNATGSEKWAYELIDTLLNSPIVPYNVIKSLVKKDLYATKLSDLGNFLATQKDPYGNVLFNSNPIKPLMEDGVILSSDPEESVKKIIKKYIKPLLASNLIWMQDDLLFEAIETNKAGKFLELFEIQSGESEGDFIDRVESSTEFRQFLKDIGVPLIHGIPPFAPTEATIQFKDNYKITEASTILPRTGISFTNMLMATSGLEEIQITKKKVSEIVGEYLPENAKYLASKEIWWAEVVEKEQIDTTTSTQDEMGWMKDFILALATKVSGEDITAEVRFSKVITDVKKYVKEFQKKVEEREKEFFKENFVTATKVNSVVSFQLVDFEEAPIADIKEVTFIPHIENRKSFEIRALEGKAKVLTPVDTQARFKKTITVYSPEAFIDENGDEATNGEWRYIEDYNVKITLSDGEVFYLDHPISLFAIEQNNLNYIYIDKNFDMSMADGAMPVDEFHYQVLTNGDNLFYPLLNRELATYNNLNFKAMDGVRFGVLAENWQQQIDLDIWNAPVIPKPKEEELINEFKIAFGSGISEGALIMVDVEQNAKLRQAYGNAKLLMTIDYADEMSGEVGVAIEPMPQDNFDADFISEEGTPVCPTGFDENGQQIFMDLPKRPDGTYPFPEDPDFPKECQMDIFGEVQTCWAESSQKEITLQPRPDGSYPWPGDPDYPKECLTSVTEIIPTDCQGNPFPYDEVTGKYIYPENEMFPTDKYDLSCMTANYFDDFGDRPVGGVYEDKCDTNKDGIIDDTEKEQCASNMVDNVGDMYQDKCDFNGDGVVDDTEAMECKNNLMDTVSTTYQAQCDTNKDGVIDDIEKKECANQYINGEPKECYDNMGNVVPCDEPKECKDENGNMIACMPIEEEGDFNGDGVIDENEKKWVKGHCDYNRDNMVDEIEKQECKLAFDYCDTNSDMVVDENERVQCEEKCDFNNDGIVMGGEAQECFDNVVNTSTNNTSDMCGNGDAPYLVDSDMRMQEFYFNAGDYVEINLNDYFTFSECTIKNFGMFDWDSEDMSEMMRRAMGDSIDGLVLDNETGIYSGVIAESEAMKTFKVKVNASNENGTSPDITFVFHIKEATNSEMM